MSNRYNAFISYNHNPRDSKIALMLQQKLERFSLPHGMDKQETAAGLSKIERVFLDTGELEVAGDLNEVIMDALGNSDNLIVICSPEAKESIWVQREIEYFLKNHTFRDILTVITAGEPMDVLPDAILYEKVTDENGQTTKKLREPLSADYRMPLRKANTYELPRLVAALIGCRYDDLVQRQRAYRMRRLIMLSAAAAIVLMVSTAYLIWSNHQINANFEKSLYEQAYRVAAQSEETLSRGDRIGAVRYALEALPSEDNSRQPLIPEAIKALADALDVYTCHPRPYTATRQYGDTQLPAFVDSGSINGDVYLARLNHDYTVDLWNAETGKEIMPDYFGKELPEQKLDVVQIYFTDSGRLVLLVYDEMITIDPAEAKELDRIKLSEGDEELKFVSAGTDSVIRGEDVWVPVRTSEQTYQILEVDSGTGEIKRTIDLEAAADKITVSPDGKLVAYYGVTHSGDNDGEDVCYYGVKDVESGKELTSGKEKYITDIAFNRNNDLVISGLAKKPAEGALSNEESIHGPNNVTKAWFSVKDNRTITVSCIDPQTGEALWKCDKASYSNGMPSITPGTGTFSSYLFCTTGTNLLIISDKGKIHKDFDLGSNVSCFLQDEKSSSEIVRMILEDGSLARYNTADESLYISRNVFMERINNCCITRKDDSWYIFTLTDSFSYNLSKLGTLTQYSESDGDSKLTFYTHDGDDAWESRHYLMHTVEPYEDNFLEMLYSMESSGGKDTGKTHLVMRRSEDGRILFTKDFVTTVGLGTIDPGVEDTCYSFCGIDEDTGKAYWLDFEGEKAPSLISIDLKDGSDTYIPLTITLDGHVFEKEKEKIRFPGAYPYNESCKTACGFKDGKLLCIVNAISDGQYGNKLISVDPVFGKGEIRSLGYGLGMYCCLDVRHGKCISAYDELICCDYTSGKVLWTNETLNPDNIKGIAVSEDGIVAVGETINKSTHIHLFDIETGEERGEITLDSYSYVDHLEFRDVSDDEYLLTIREYSTDGYLIDKNTLKVRTTINGVFISYNPKQKLFLIGDEANGDTGCVPYRSLDDMIKEGNELIK